MKDDRTTSKGWIGEVKLINHSALSAGRWTGSTQLEQIMDRREQINYRLLNQTCANRGDALSKIDRIVRNTTSVEEIRRQVLEALRQCEQVDQLREERSRKEHERLDADEFAAIGPCGK